MKTAEQLRQENWTSRHQWEIYRNGKSDGIVVLVSKHYWGRRKSIFTDFLIFKDGKMVDDSAISYKDANEIVKRLKNDRWIITAYAEDNEIEYDNLRNMKMELEEQGMESKIVKQGNGYALMYKE